MIFNSTIAGSGGGGGSSKTVTVSLTNPLNPSNAANPACKIFEWYASGGTGDQIGSIASPTGSTTVEVGNDVPGIYVEFYGTYVAVRYDGCSCTGGAIRNDYYERAYSIIVIDDGAVVIDSVDYDD